MPNRVRVPCSADNSRAIYSYTSHKKGQQYLRKMWNSKSYCYGKEQVVLKCPNCEKIIRISLFQVQNITVKCTCGTKVTIAPGYFKDSVVHWETPEQSQSK